MAGGSVNWYNYLEKTVWPYLVRVKILILEMLVHVHEETQISV